MNQQEATDAALANERAEHAARLEAREAAIRDIEERLANETPECRACHQRLPSESSIDALARLLSEQMSRETKVVRYSFGGVEREWWREGFCGAACSAQLSARRESRATALRVLSGGQP